MEKSEIESWLREEDEDKLQLLWHAANEARAKHIGDEVYLRGLIEISNYCRRACHYCGLRSANRGLPRYRLLQQEALMSARKAASLGYSTVVLQAGEDSVLTQSWMGTLIRRIKTSTGLVVTLSLGERTPEELVAWKLAGADRYFLRFETSNEELYRKVHPSWPAICNNRFELLAAARNLGYEIGSGLMVGLPGQSYEDLVRDIQLLKKHDFDMIGVGPFIPHPDTPLGQVTGKCDDQVPATSLMTWKTVALARLVCPDANIPSTTALSLVEGPNGHRNALNRGANILMLNVTPEDKRDLYEIYPGKGKTDTPEAVDQKTREMITKLCRKIGKGRGDAPRFSKRKPKEAWAL